MKLRKRTALLTTVPTVVLLCLAGVWLFWEPQSINRAAYQRLQLGMTEAEVEAAIGCPPTGLPQPEIGPDGLLFLRRGIGAVVDGAGESWETWDHDSVRAWYGEEYAIKVAFAEDRASASS